MKRNAFQLTINYCNAEHTIVFRYLIKYIKDNISIDPAYISEATIRSYLILLCKSQYLEILDTNVYRLLVQKIPDDKTIRFFRVRAKLIKLSATSNQ